MYTRFFVKFWCVKKAHIKKTDTFNIQYYFGEQPHCPKSRTLCKFKRDGVGAIRTEESAGVHCESYMKISLVLLTKVHIFYTLLGLFLKGQVCKLLIVKVDRLALHIILIGPYLQAGSEKMKPFCDIILHC